MHGDLQNLIDFVSRHVVFDEEHYPSLVGASEEARLQFALKHSALHFAKGTGKIAAIGERADHGKEFVVDDMKAELARMLITTLWTADKIGMTQQDFVAAIEEKYGSKP